MQQLRSWIGLAVWILACLAAGAIGGIASINARGFYQQLERPAWAPPGWLFGPVWTTLYVLMGIAAWLVWRRVGWDAARIALALIVATIAAFGRVSRLAAVLLVPYLAWVAFATALTAVVWNRNRGLL